MRQTQQINPISSVSNVTAALAFEKPVSVYQSTQLHILDNGKCHASVLLTSGYKGINWNLIYQS
jgi:predicted choloylglycine hydrolase